MIPHVGVKVRGVQPLDGYRLRVLFSDGTVGDIDMEPWLRGPVFEPLRDPTVFRSVRVDARKGLVVWPSGADLAPDMLRDRVTVVAPGGTVEDVA